MASVFFRRRETKAGAVRWQVCFRLGGREAPERYDSTWPTKGLADRRREVILRAWAEGQDVPPVGGEHSSTTVRDVLVDYREARRDVGPARHATYHQVAQRLGRLGDMDPRAVRPTHVRAWIGELAVKLSPQTIRMHLSVVRQVLDHAGLHPNPARHASVRVPRQERKLVQPPSTADFHALVEAINPQHRFPLVLLEATGLRIGELERLTWGDVDEANGRLRVAGGKTRNARRWVPLEPWALRVILASRPREDRRPDDQVVDGFNHKTFRHALARAARFAGTAVYSPHDLRHRYISLLVHAGVPAPIVGQVVGHARASVTIDVYAHVLVDERPARLAELRRVVIEAASGGVAPVRPDLRLGIVERAQSPAYAALLDLMGSTGIDDREGPG